MNRESALLDLGSRIVRDHERSQGDVTNLTSVVVDNLDEALPVLEAIARVCRGTLLNTRDNRLQGPVEATTNGLRRQAVESAFETGDTRTVSLSFTSDTIDAFFPGIPAGASSVGQEMVLAVVRALLHRDLDDHPISIITFSESSIDYPYRRLIWDLLNHHLKGMPSQTLRTLVVVSESPIDVDLHCGTGTGFRLALQDDRVLVRHGADDLAANAQMVASWEEPFVMFLGAGFAASSRMPLGNRMRDQAIRRLLGFGAEEPLTSAELADRFYGWISEKSDWLSPTEQQLTREQYVDHLTLEQVVRAEKRIHPSLPTLADFRAHHDEVISAPGQAVLDLCSLLASPSHRPIVVELNFDLLIETHCSSELKVFATEDEFAAAAEYVTAYLAGDVTAIPLLKLHGSIERPESCVVTTSQTEGGVGPAKLETLRALHHGGSPRPWLYVGTSMRDLDLRAVLREEDFALGVDERWVEPFLSVGVEQFGLERAAHWKRTDLPTIQDRLITETADAFFGAVRDALSV